MNTPTQPDDTEREPTPMNTATIPALPAGELTDDRDEYTVDDDTGTWCYRLSLEPDDSTYEDLEDPDVFGRISFTPNVMETRPSDFDGSACKIHLGNYHPSHSTIWWQPPPDLTSARRWGGNPDDFPAAVASFRRHVVDVLSYGYTVFVLTLSHTRPDGYSRQWTASIGGVEPFPDREHVAALVDDLAAELTHDVDDTAVTT